MSIKKDKINTAQRIRRGLIPRKEPDGRESTHIFVSGEADGRYFAHPTLFPSIDKPGSWEQHNADKAFEVAKERGEIFEFKTEKEAQDFAKGSWKSLKAKREAYQEKSEKRRAEMIRRRKEKKRKGGSVRRFTKYSKKYPGVGE